MFKHLGCVFFAGMLLGAVLVGMLWFGRVAGKGFASWGQAEIYFDADARERMGEKIIPSDEAKDLYFYIDGFQDHNIFIAYTDTERHLEKVVKDLTGKSVHELEVWADQIKPDPEAYTQQDGTTVVWSNPMREPGARDKKLLTSLYDVDVIRKGRFFLKDETTHGWHIIVDEETGRFYYYAWDM